MNVEQSAAAMFTFSMINNIILEKFITHTIPNNNEITFEYLINVV